MVEPLEARCETRYRHRQSSYLKSLVVIALLVACGTLSFSVSHPLSTSLWAMAGGWSIWLCLDWQWATFWLNADGRLAAQRAALASEQGRSSFDRTP
ncbi:MAG: hypothetical protein JXA14_22790 [Anaerolineae bacterium]|nr:hypothetical protein [Anaerolineae bacterium]